MLKFKRRIILIVVLLLGIMLTGCTGDSPVSELTEGIEGPSQVIVGIESDEFTAAGETGANYVWQVDGEDLGYFTAPQSATTRFVASSEAENEGTVSIRALIDSEPTDWVEIEVLGQESETEYAAGTFHAIIATEDMKRKGYIAAGTSGILGDNNKPYMLKADNRGIIIDDKVFNREGRFYDVQDAVTNMIGDTYYLIGYGEVSGGVYEAFALKLNNKMEIQKEYNSNTVTTGDAFLRSGIISEKFFSADHLIAVGTHELVNGNFAPYIVDINVKDEDKINHHTLEDAALQNPYYNLESIIETDNGYIAVGFTDPDGTDRYSANVSGVLMTLDQEFNVTSVDDESFTEKLFKIRKVADNKFVVVGDQGYIAEINNSGTVILEDHIGTAKFRDVIVDGDYYVAVGRENGEGVAAKIAVDSLYLDSAFGKINHGDYLFAVDKATDSDYLLAGYSSEADGTTYSYVVKVDPNDGSVVDRVKE